MIGRFCLYPLLYLKTRSHVSQASLCSWGWHQCPILLPPLLMCLYYKCTHHPVFVVLAMEHRTLCVLDKYSTNWITSPPLLWLFNKGVYQSNSLHNIPMYQKTFPCCQKLCALFPIPNSLYPLFTNFGACGQSLHICTLSFYNWTQKFTS